MQTTNQTSQGLRPLPRVRCKACGKEQDFHRQTKCDECGKEALELIR